MWDVIEQQSLWLILAFLLAPALVCGWRASHRGHCPVAFALCGLTLSWGAFPMTCAATGGKPPDWDQRHRRLAEGRLQAGAQLLLAGTLGLVALGVLFPLGLTVDGVAVEGGVWAPTFLPLVCGYACLPSVMWLHRKRFRIRSWCRPLEAALALPPVQRMDMEDVAATAALVRVGVVFWVVLLTAVGVFLKYAMWATLLPLTG